MRLFLVSRVVLLLTILVGVCDMTFSQSLYPPKVESPNAASLGTFGEVPVNMFTGTPNISIPLHTLSYGNISVPISLRYHQSSVKPGVQPGWVGSGWDLESIGSITRQVRGQLDEFYIEASTGNATHPSTGFYYPFPGQSTTPGSEYANNPGWSSSVQLVYDFTAHTNIFGIDVQADEFSFNVMGHSGKFYYSGNTLGWQVVSDEKIKVELTDFYTPNEIRDAIKQFAIPENQNALSVSHDQPRSFGGFVITVPDGTKYYFGGKGGNVADAVEFSSPRTTIEPYTKPVFTATSWLLKKIVDVNNNTVVLSYERKFPTCNLLLGLYELNASCAQNNVSIPAFLFGGGFAVPLIGSSATFSSDYVDTNQHTGGYQWPMYLASIQSPNEKIFFSKSDAVCRRYTNAQLSYSDVVFHTTNDIDNSVLGLSWPDNLNRLQWQQLDKIVVTDNMINSNGSNGYSPNTIRQFKFNYSNSPDKRLTLNSLQVLDKDNIVASQYEFEYNNVTGADLNTTNEGVPVFADGNFSDHWGYYNNTNIHFARTADIFSRRQPNPLVVTAGLLNKIKYPTGGYTSFIWESNDYSRVVSITRQAPYVSSAGYGSGSRIAEIKSFLANGSLAAHKKYYYKQNYTAGAAVSSLPSSGVLNGIPQYSFSLTNRTGVLGYAFNSLLVTYFHGTTNFSYAGQGAAVGYDEVVEVNLDGSYTRNVFTNYGTDLNGESHWDNPPSGYLGWNPALDTYFPRATLEGERGKPVGIFVHAANNTLLKKTNIVYRNDPGRFGNYVKLIDLNGSYGSGSCGDALVLATARPVYNYNYYPVSQTVTSYDQQGNNPSVQTSSFTYNSHNLLKTKTEINSKNETIVTTLSYPTDFPDATSQAMVAAHILTPVVQSVVTRNGVQTNFVKTNYSQPYPGIFVPESLQMQVGNNPPETRQQVNKVDTKGHVLEVQRTNDVKEVYIWGCNSQYIMAKIVGADHATASALINQSLLDQAGVGYNSYTDENIRTELNKLRTGLPNALVTTYTYRPGIGLATETNPNGITVFYTYDASARVSAIIDKDNHVLKKFCYNYAGQPENCTTASFVNDQQQATFTRNTGCPAGTVLPTYTYVVPAGTFTSFVSKDAANQMATDAMNSNGQAAANSLACLAPFSGLNSTTAAWSVTVSNGSFNNTYSLYPGSSATLLANIPVGIYDITIVPMYSGSVTSPMQLILNGTTYSGMSFNLTGINLSTATTFTLHPPPPSGTCSFSMASGYSSPTNSISKSGSVVSFYIVFYRSTSMTAGSSYQVATINGSCRPSVTRTINYSSSGRNWTITIYPSGQMSWYLAPGSPPVNANSTISTSTLTYNL